MLENEPPSTKLPPEGGIRKLKVKQTVTWFLIAKENHLGLPQMETSNA